METPHSTFVSLTAYIKVEVFKIVFLQGRSENRPN